nr:MAG TPA: hypothetical protein [Caudoviricetes sp.]DAT57691.1 MAG TPA: hypothetical protein [Caudoviricetes sp.]
MFALLLGFFYSTKIIIIVIPKTRELKHTLSSFSYISVSVSVLCFYKLKDRTIIQIKIVITCYTFSIWSRITI